MAALCYLRPLQRVDRIVTDAMLGTWGGHTGSEEMIRGDGTHFDENEISVVRAEEQKRGVSSPGAAILNSQKHSGGAH